MNRVELNDLIAVTLDISPERVDDQLSFQDVPQWDSLGHVELMLALEAEFGLEINADLIVELTNVHAIRKFLDKSGRT